MHSTDDLAPTERIGVTHEDLDAVLKSYGQVLDISRDDLEDIILATEMKAYERRFGVITCGAIMSRDTVTVEFSTALADAWRLMRRHMLHALPVLNKARRVIGVVAQSDFLTYSEQGESVSFAERMRRLRMNSPDTHSDQPEVVGPIMTTKVVTTRPDKPIVELVPLMSNTGCTTFRWWTRTTGISAWSASPICWRRCTKAACMRLFRRRPLADH